MPIKGTDIPIPDTSAPEFLWRRCRGRDDQVAFIDNNKDGKSLTYKEVYEKSRNCAAFLLQKGAKTGDFIGLCAPSSPEYSIAMLGIMGSGATVTPCNPAYTDSEILQQFTISEPKMVIVDETAVETMKRVQAKLPCLEEIFVMGPSDTFTTLDTMSDIYNKTDVLENVRINSSDDIAILPYSSGTTGLPKSVMLTHRNLLAMFSIYMNDNENWSGINQVAYIDRPMYHAGGYIIVLLSLAIGFKVIVEKEFKVVRMLQTIEKYKVTNLITVPPILVELANTEGTEIYDTSSMVSIIGGGAALAPDIMGRMAKKFNVTMRAAYGMTESGIISETRGGGGCGYTSVGYVMPTVELQITDLATAEECPTDQDGEILVRGPQVMKGYLKNPEANAKTFDKDGWMHTGDIGHLDKIGRLYVVDRLKEVIKYKSLQVPPAELESVILKHPKVADVGVIGIPDEAAGELPKAFVVKKDPSLAEQEIHEFVKSQLADYKQLRGGVEFVETIPKSGTGKIQRNELKKMAGIEI